MGKESQTHAAVHCMWGMIIKLHYITRLIINIQSHSCLPHSLDVFWVIVNLRLGFFPSTVWCMLCFLFVRVHGHDGELSSSFPPPSPQQTCTSRSGFYFFLLCVFPGPHPTRSAHEHHRIMWGPRTGIRKG